MEKRKKPEEDGAPAYMAQFTALMTILLAFFITMLTMGQNRNSKYKEGMGFLRDSFGSMGGTGLLPFLKSMMPKHPDVKKREKDGKAEFLGYEKGTFHTPRFDAKGISSTEIENRGYSIRLITPITFDDDTTAITEDTRRFLDRISSALCSLPNHVFTACSFVETGAPEEDLLLAAKRSAVITRYLEKECAVPRKQMNAIGYAHTRYIGSLSNEQSAQAVVLFIRKQSYKKNI